jgi:hypothetical protein
MSQTKISPKTSEFLADFATTLVAFYKTFWSHWSFSEAFSFTLMEAFSMARAVIKQKLFWGKFYLL